MGFQTLIGFIGATASPTVFGLILDKTNATLSSAQGGMPTVWGWAFGILGLGALIGPAVLVVVRRLPASAQMAGGKR